MLFARHRIDLSQKLCGLIFRSSGVAFGAGAFRTAAMKRLALLILVVGFGLGACERHDFEETRKLHDHHEKHDTHEPEGHSEKH